jgi:hypothetical protein
LCSWQHAYISRKIERAAGRDSFFTAARFLSGLCSFAARLVAAVKSLLLEVSRPGWSRKLRLIEGKSNKGDFDALKIFFRQNELLLDIGVPLQNFAERVTS